MQFNKFTYSGLIVAGAIFFFAQSALGEHNYKLVITRLEKPKVDPKWAKLTSLKVNKVNSTCTTISGTAELFKDLPSDKTIECKMIAYNSIGGGEYKKTVNGFGPSPVCEFIEKDEFAFPSLAAASNVPKKCPIKKGKYEIRNWDLNTAKLIDDLPQPNDWKVEVIITVNKKDIIRVVGYGKIIRTIGF